MATPATIFVNRRIPLYYQLENILREKIMSGAFAPGARLPTEFELVRQFGVSRITVRQALTTLVKEGLIERRQGRGTFATERKTRPRPFEGKIDLTGSMDQIITAGLDTPCRVIEMNRLDADPHEAEFLGVHTGEAVYRIERLNLCDGKPFGLTVSYLPANIGDRLTIEDLNLGSLLQMIETRFGLKLKNARQRFTASLADPYLARLLDVRVGSPLLSIERAVYANDNHPVEFARALYNADIQSYSIYLTRDVKRRK